MIEIDDYLNSIFEKEEELQLIDYKINNPLEKIEGLIKFIQVLDYQNQNCSSEIKRIQDLKKSNEKKIERIKKYIASLIDKPIRIGTYTISTRKSESVEVLDETKVPSEFFDEKTTFTLSKTKIKDYLSKDIIDHETGEVKRVECDWARINYNTNLIIK